MLEIGLVGGIAFGGLAAALVLIAWLRRLRTRVAAERSALRAAPAPGAEPPMGVGPAAGEATGSGQIAGGVAARRLELRLEAVEARLAEVTAEGSPEERLRDMAGSLVGLIRDKNATLETALAGLDQLRARLRALERIGDVAEARALFEDLGGRLEALHSAQAAQAAETGERIEALRGRAEAGDVARDAVSAAVSEQIAALREDLHERKDAGLAALIERFGPFETRLAALETAQGAEEAAGIAMGAAVGATAEAVVEAVVEAEIRAEIARMEARIETRIESRFAALDTAREAGEIALATLRAEMGAEIRAEIRAEVGAEVREVRAEVGTERDMVIAALGSLREIAERLSGLHAQDEALARTFAARITALEEQVAALDPGAALESLAERLEAARTVQDEADRAREAGVRAALDGLAERFETARAAQAETGEAFGARIDALETAGTPLAAFETRLADLEARPAASPEQEVLAEARAAALALIDEQTALFANRLALLEASLPSPAGIHTGLPTGIRAGLHARALGDETGAGEQIAEGTAPEEIMEETSANEMDANEMDAGEMAGPGSAAIRSPAPDPVARDADLAAIRNMRRIVSLHRK
ncbi:hypothetical protein [Amaricoccus sp. W119]|uniref:hypothetical protein n=1 Tax=Amaricoccus sp. W119 TaxID=3391833 RepID=UPI0039A65E56